jgi:hypothetical protein
MLLGGHHRLAALKEPEVQALLAQTGRTVDSWRCRVVSKAIWNLNNHTRILNSFAFFDNFQHNSSNIVETCDAERAICILNLLSSESYRGWQTNMKTTQTRVMEDMVCVSHMILEVFG